MNGDKYGVTSEQCMHGSICDVFKVENLLHQPFKSSITSASIVGDAEVKAAAFLPRFQKSPFSSDDPQRTKYSTTFEAKATWVLYQLLSL